MTEKFLKDRVAIISGGARGVGKAIAQSLAKRGCNIAIIDSGVSISGEKIEDKNIAKNTSEEISNDYSVLAKGYSEDISNYQTVEKICKEIKNSFGNIDIVINNAAILRDSFIFKLEKNNWDKVINTNLSGAFNLISCSSKIMREQAKNDPEYKNGRIFNIISTSGIWGNFGQAAYASAKAGLIALTKVSALDLQRTMIPCNAIAPFAATRVTESINPQNEEQTKYKSLALKIKAHYVGELVCVLCRKTSIKITGQVFGVRGKEVFIFNNSKPVYTYVRTSESIDDLEKEIEENFLSHSSPLKTDLEIFSSDPII